MFDIESLVYMVRSSYRQKPYRRLLMEAHGAEVFASPSQRTDFGRTLLAQEPDHPGSEGIAVSEAITTVLESSDSRLGMGGFGNHVLLHQTVIGLETRLQLEQIDREPNYLIASCGCGSNLGGLIIPWLPERLSGGRVRFVAAESTACPSLTLGEYKYDPSDASGLGPLARTFTLGHDFVPPAIGAGGLRYHGVAPLIGLLKAEGLLQVSAYTPAEIAHAGRLFLQLHGLVPAPETAHAIRAVIDATRETSEDARPAIIVMCFSGDGLLDLDSYDVGVPEDVDSRTSSLAGKY
jgi:tryptophan synthase beta chain